MPATLKPNPELDLVLYSMLLREPLGWLWPGRIPLGRLTVISGEPGLGKSLLALDIAARVTRGGDWPDIPRPADSPATNPSPRQPIILGLPEVPGQPTLAEQLAARRELNTVFLLNAADHLEDSVSPSLLAAKADIAGVFGIKGIYSRERSFRAPPQGIDLMKHLPLLKQQLKDVRNVRLMVIDPFVAYWGKIGYYPTKSTYRVADALSELAAEFNMAVLVITDTRHAGLPSRNAWTVRRSWEDDNLRLWSPTQFHYGPCPTGLTYRIEGNHIKWEPGPLTLPRNLDGTPRHVDATEWLSEFLSKGPREATEIYTSGEALGLSESQLRRAKEDLRLTTRKRSGVDYGKWTWELP